MIGVEALLRWDSDKLGSVSPAEFIPVAEHTGIILPIGHFVFEQALKATASWRKLGTESLTVAINLSPRQFRDPSLADTIKQALLDSSVPPEAIELEITEGVLMSGHSHIDRAVTDITDLGVNIAMDDFGTGYSSLSYLRTYPFNVLKIDRSFIIDIAEDRRDYELVSAAIAMAHSLGLKVIAEGVETTRQLELLAQKNCDFAQGFLFSKAVSFDQITAMLRQQ